MHAILRGDKNSDNISDLLIFNINSNKKYEISFV